MGGIHKVLYALVRRAAKYKRPFNVQDSVLILKALHALRYRSADVRLVCEKCAFTIASARIAVPVERVVDVLNALLSLQAAPLPVVHEKLADRLLEVSTRTASPQSAQKAAVVVMKLGKRYCRPELANHVFDVLMEFVASHPNDVALRLAVISVFSYTSSATEKRGVSCGDSRNENVRLLAVLEAARHVVDARVLGTLRGNSTLQALHILPVISGGLMTRRFSRTKDDAATAAVATGDEGIDSMATLWEHVGRAFCSELQLTTVVPGGYAQFLYDFLPTILVNKTSCDMTKLLQVIQNEDLCKALNSYDVAKIAMAVSHAISAWHPRHTPRLQDGDDDDDEEGETTERPQQQQQQQEDHKKEQRLLLYVFGRLVDQLDFFYKTAWSLSSEKSSDGGRSNNNNNNNDNNDGYGGSRVDQVAVGALWHVAHKCVCEMREEGAEARDIVARLVQLTENVSKELSDVWPWVLYSMSMCARTAVYTTALGDVVEVVVRESFLAHQPSKLRSPPAVRSCVQALYAFSILMVPSLAEWGLLRRARAPVERQERIRERVDRWVPAHPPLVECMVQHLLQCRYQEYPADDVPMLLQGLANLAEAAAMRHLQLPTGTHELTERVLHYLQGSRNADWLQKHGMGVSCTLIVLAEFMPRNRRVREIAMQFLSRILPGERAKLGSLSHLMEHAIALKRRGTGTMTWAGERILAIAAVQISLACTGSRSPDVQRLLRCADLATELGAVVVFIGSEDETVKTTTSDESQRMKIGLNLSALMRSGAMTPVDAAHVLLLMSYNAPYVDAAGTLKDYITQLRHISIGGKSPSVMQVQTLLYLLRANTDLYASRSLFDEASLASIMSHVCHFLIGREKDTEQVWDAGRIVRALLSSQLLLRLKQTIQSYDGLSEAVGGVLDALEAAGVETPEVLFKLRLLSGQ